MSKRGRVTPLSPLLPRLQKISLGTVGFEAQILELMKDNLLRLATKTRFLESFLLNCVHVFGTC